ncbi:MAG: hypothetical protein ACP5MD_03190 [Verrucomicrobiia bacterium]
MYIEELDQDIAIASVVEAESLVVGQPAYWNVISICDGLGESAWLVGARSVLQLDFDDVEDMFLSLGGVMATKEDITRALKFARKIKREPLLIHCTVGVSRSTAMAWIITCDKLRGRSDAARKALEIVRTVRPMLMPNRHVLKLGIAVLGKNRAEREQLRRDLAPVF